MTLDPLHQVTREKLAEFCRENAIRRLAVFGSVARSEQTSTSDLDLLVEFEQGVRIGFDFFRIQDDLSNLFGRRVELATPAGLRNAYRDRILSSARDIYVAA